MHFFCHKMLVGVCGRTEKHFTRPFLAFCANSEVNFTPKIGSKMAKFKVFGYFETLISKIMILQFVTFILLIKIQLLVPNLCLQDLLCRFYGQKSEKKNESIQKSGSGPINLWTILSYKHAFIATVSITNVFQKVQRSFWYLNHHSKCLHSKDIVKFVTRKAKKWIFFKNRLKYQFLASKSLNMGSKEVVAALYCGRHGFTMIQ